MKKITKLALGSKKHIAPVTPAAAPTPLTPVQQHSGSKRPWIAVSADDAPNTSKGSTSTAHLIELPHQEPASLFSNKGTP